MSPDQIISLVVAYKYLILFPAAILEGHVVSLIVGFLARGGYLNPYIAGSIIAAGNITGDVIIYWLGYHKGESFVQKWGKYFGITKVTIERSKNLFQTHHGKILFFTKLTNGFGLQIAILFTAGLSRVPFYTYMFWNVLGEIIWTSTLIALGYIFGHLYMLVETTISRIGILVFILLLIAAVFKLQEHFFKPK